MKKLIMVVILVQTATICFAETFFWEDKKGIHTTEDVSKLPPKFRNNYEKYKKQNMNQVPESAKAAVKALKKLQARTQTGISRGDFSSVLGETNFEVNTFLESKEADNFPLLKISLQTAMAHYGNASTFWELRSTFHDEESYGHYYLSSQFSTLFLSKYPEAKKDIKDGGVLSGGKVYFDSTIGYIFAEASKEISKSNGLINK